MLTYVNSENLTTLSAFILLIIIMYYIFTSFILTIIYELVLFAVLIVIIYFLIKYHTQRILETINKMNIGELINRK
mgnify:CR=1 FL=1